MNNNKSLLHSFTLLAAGLGLSLAASVASADLLEEVQERGVLNVGTEFHFAPFAYLEAGQQTGLNLELMERVGDALGVTINWIDLPWPSVLPGLEAGNYDFVAGPAMITQERKQRYHFTLPIADATVAILKRADDDSIQSPEDISGKAAGGGRGTAQLEQLRAFAAELPEPPTITEYVDYSQTYADLAAGRIDAVANSLPNIAYTATQRPMFTVVQPPFGQPAYFGYMARNDDVSASLVDAIDEVILSMHEDGTMAELQTKWFGEPMDVPTEDFEPAI
ncbi:MULTISPECIES: transporter substrate-binding domain-containing protein [Halomonadaceae]|uniref:transporter substrate-binding domain-containing protein n=1 Tax=Halomonadaceae TaxID=28256 RepID=UPI0015990CA4|nr:MULTISPECIES: transporter substrate-binding domain-containing protein [Halomonas]QJQ93866.1 transporter substrate-binding domain-containing protein [Halomonas sp. PA5]